MIVLWVLALCLGVSVEGVLLSLPKLKVPLYADPRQPAQLSCFYPNTPPEYTIGTVKWFRHDYLREKEVLRFVPTPEPRIYKTDLGEGTIVDNYACDETQCVIEFKPSLSDELTANYSCEVFYEGPDSNPARSTAPMNVVALPNANPVILDEPRSVQPGQELVLNCTSDYSHPPAVIKWYINHEYVEIGNMANNLGAVSSPRPDGLSMSWRVIRIKAAPAEERDQMILHCEATVKVQPPIIKRTIKLVPFRFRMDDAL